MVQTNPICIQGTCSASSSTGVSVSCVLQTRREMSGSTWNSSSRSRSFCRRQHVSAYVSIRQNTSAGRLGARARARNCCSGTFSQWHTGIYTENHKTRVRLRELVHNTYYINLDATNETWFSASSSRIVATIAWTEPHFSIISTSS